MKRIGQLFLQGLFALLPAVITLYILWWLGNLAESTLGSAIRWFIPHDWYVPGMGIAAGFGVAIAMGILLQAYLFRKIVNGIDYLLQKVPLVKTIYGSVRDIAKFASSKDKDGLQKTVLLTLDNDLKVLGFVTSKPISLAGNDQLIPVYFPMSYQIGGYTLMVPESRLEFVNMDAKDAMRFILTAGMTSESTVAQASDLIKTKPADKT